MREKLKDLALLLFHRGLTIGTIEHCTSGLLGASISSMCGLSPLYRGTIVATDEERMEKLLEVSPNVFKNNGLVSSQVACQMALGGLYKLDVDICVSVVGNVVPPTLEEEPNNYVWICTAIMMEKKVDFSYSKIEVNGLRGKNIEDSIEAALDCVLKEIKRIEEEE